MTMLTGPEIVTKGDPWLVSAYRNFRDELLDPGYPCYFGTQAEKEGFLRYAAIEADNLAALSDALTKFIDLSRAHPRHRHVLVAFFDLAEPLEAASDRFWRVLQWLHDHDPQPWPADVPDSPDDPGWEFCFNGDAMFAFPVIPAYETRRSRGLGIFDAICFQPRRIFAGVNRDDPGGEPIRRHIYERVRHWDAIPPHPELEHLAYGDGNMREWRQYVLPDGNTELLGRCPLNTTQSDPAVR